MIYTIKRLSSENLNTELRGFIAESCVKVNDMHGNKYNWERFSLSKFADTQYFIMCFRDREPVGFLMATFCESFFDSDCIILRQNLLFSLPNTRASNYLMKEFIDFGKLSANHIITAKGPLTNIKSKSLEKLGFVKLEEIYRMEV